LDNYRWSDEGYHKELGISHNLMLTAEAHDNAIEEDAALKLYTGTMSPDVSSLYAAGTRETKMMGGPVYVQVNERYQLKNIDHSAKAKGA
jgi:hypothetical protein